MERQIERVYFDGSRQESESEENSGLVRAFHSSHDNNCGWHSDEYGCLENEMTFGPGRPRELLGFLIARRTDNVVVRAVVIGIARIFGIILQGWLPGIVIVHAEQRNHAV